jgi:hypothetical protein
MLLLLIEKKNLYISTQHEEKFSCFILITMLSINLDALMQNIWCSSQSEKSFIFMLTRINQVIFRNRWEIMIY